MQRTGPLLMLETQTDDGTLVEAALADVPDAMVPGSRLVLEPLVVRAFPA
jgi:hypothetical protein